MKRILLILLAALCALGLAACSTTGAPPTSSAPQSSTAPAPSLTPSPSPSAAAAPSPANPVIRLSTTTSVNDSGILPYLQPYFEADTGYRLEVTSAGTGAAIEKARTGDADCLLVHSKSQEEQFIADGFSDKRVSFMYNFFVVVGPAGDPAGVAQCATAADAFKAIASSKSPFISRGDKSGTNTAELKIWDSAGITPSGDWYVSTGQGMGPSITVAAEKQAYILTDKATYLAHESRSALSILLKESDDLKNTYSMLAVSPGKWPDTNYDGALAFIAWMTSAKAADLIADFGAEIYGEPLFYIFK